MIDNFEYFFKFHYQYLLIIAGLVVIIGAILDWNWISNYGKVGRRRLVRSIIRSKFGEAGVRKYERAVTGFAGAMLIVCGIILLVCVKE